MSLTYHAGARRLQCHHCDYQRAAPAVCPNCQGQRIRPFGIGTEKVEEEVKKLYPEARVLRMDRDTTAKKDAHFKMLRAFKGGEADILIGTQMVAQGPGLRRRHPGRRHLGGYGPQHPRLPRRRACVPGAHPGLRACRTRRRPGHVLVQTFNPEHESVAAAAEHDYEAFYTREIKNRRELSYPPFTRLANVIAQDEDGRAAEARLRALSSLLGGRSLLDPGPAALGGDDDLEVLGPAPCPLSRLRGRYRWHLLLKAPKVETLRERLSAAFSKLSASERSGVTIDIDPMSLL